MGERQQKEEECLRPCLTRPESDDLCGIVKGSDEHRSKEVDEHPDYLRAYRSADGSESRALLGAVILPGSKVLADEGSKGHGEAGNRQEAEALNLRVSAASGDSHLSELVDISLNKHVRNGNDGILESGGQPVGKNPLKHILFDMDFPEGDPELFRAAQQLAQTKAYADELGDNRRKGGSAHPMMEHADEN